MADRWNVQAACGDVGGDEDFDLAALEFSEQAFALGLRYVAGQRGDAEALFSSARVTFRRRSWCSRRRCCDARRGAKAG
jgi:hypothetical protein